MRTRTLAAMLLSLFNEGVALPSGGLFIETSTDLDGIKRERLYFEINGRDTPRMEGQLTYFPKDNEEIEIIVRHEESGCVDLRRFDSPEDVPNRLRFHLKECVKAWLDQKIEEYLQTKARH